MIPIIIVYVLQCCMFYAFDTLPGPCSVKSPEPPLVTCLHSGQFALSAYRLPGPTTPLPLHVTEWPSAYPLGI
jgi:hypothetical protein